MTNREYIISLLQSRDKDAYQHLYRECSHLPSEECIKYDNCFDCWEQWLECEVSINDHA